MTAEVVSTASRPPGEPRLRSHGPPVWLLALLGTAITATFFYLSRIPERRRELAVPPRNGVSMPRSGEEAWPMPPMVRVDDAAGIAFVSVYDDSTLDFVSEKRCDPALVDTHPYDRLMGYGAVEILLTKSLE